VRGLVPRPWLYATAALVVAGVVLLATTDGTPEIIGFALLGLGAVIGTALAFYAVGRSEDAARERGDA
jgi:drug/metabolite transporter (DMT)-like permease